MTTALRPYSRQSQFWGPSPDTVLAQDHLARVVDEFVESLPLQRLNRHYEHTPGEPAYDLRLLCKVWILAYGRGLTSARELARQCVENLAFRFLTDGQCPDHRTLSGFRRNYRRLLRWVFAQTVLLGRQMGLVRLGLVAIDSVKLQADARPGRKRTSQQLKELLRRLDTYLAQLATQDKLDDQTYGVGADAESLPRKLRQLKAPRHKLARALDKLQAEQQQQRDAGKPRIRKDVIPTAPDAVWVKKHGRIIPGYNCHAAVDEACGMVVALKADACPAERDQLNPMLKEVEQTAGAPAQTALADNGYYTDAAIVQAESGSTRCLVPDGLSAHQLHQGQRPQPADPYHCDNFTYDPQADQFTCPQGRKLTLKKQHFRRGQPSTVYAAIACADCPVRDQCTRDKHGLRTIQVHRDHPLIRRAKHRLRSPEGQALYRKRKTIAEPLFGQWQHNRGVRRLRLRGLKGCDIELHLLAIGHNLKKFWKQGARFSRN